MKIYYWVVGILDGTMLKDPLIITTQDPSREEEAIRYYMDRTGYTNRKNIIVGYLGNYIPPELNGKTICLYPQPIQGY
ncbi:MAG: hypothetical protein QXM38_01150 [Candidatus Aenigmatarchaeota archaeon]